MISAGCKLEFGEAAFGTGQVLDATRWDRLGQRFEAFHWANRKGGIMPVLMTGSLITACELIPGFAC